MENLDVSGPSIIIVAEYSVRCDGWEMNENGFNYNSWDQFNRTKNLHAQSNIHNESKTNHSDYYFEPKMESSISQDEKVILYPHFLYFVLHKGIAVISSSIKM